MEDGGDEGNSSESGGLNKLEEIAKKVDKENRNNNNNKDKEEKRGGKKKVDYKKEDFCLEMLAVITDEDREKIYFNKNECEERIREIYSRIKNEDPTDEIVSNLYESIKEESIKGEKSRKSIEENETPCTSPYMKKVTYLIYGGGTTLKIKEESQEITELTEI